ncbi:MAG: hypothetical protein GXO91_07875 [FCB group bacterium]|nr:hypothetical protein [FCB group bacterium]
MAKLDFLIRGAVPRKDARTAEKAVPIHELMEGEYCNAATRQVFRTAITVSPDTLPGLRQPLDFRTPDPLILRWAGIGHPDACAREKILYIDTETTGLAGGTGTYAFMVGLGCFTAAGFRVEQYFLTDPSGEQELVQELSKAFDRFAALVSFNGKSYDLPLLQTRWILNGSTADLRAIPHIDLLPLARRLWGRTLPGCSLQQLEEGILHSGRQTGNDIPGREIPALYFDYLRSGNSAPLIPVFYHNRFDVVSMLLLLNTISTVLSNPLNTLAKTGVSPYGCARLLLDLGEADTAARLLHLGLTGHPERSECRRELSFIYKRRGHHKKAARLWQAAAEAGECYAHIELAKAAEHRDKAFDRALRHSRAALDLERRGSIINNTALDRLTHRITRLQRKLAAQKEP